MSRELAIVGAHIDAFEFCPHHPDGLIERYRVLCNCRKPQPGMIRALLERYSVDLDASFIIGDKQSDLAAARRLASRAICLMGLTSIPLSPHC